MTMKKIYLVVQEDADPYCGIHPWICLTNEEDAKELVKELNEGRTCQYFYYTEIELCENLKEAKDRLLMD